MRGYTVGFMFDKAGCVLLLRKKKPAWQAGRLNGVGGKIENGETPLECMRREFREEANLDVADWEEVCAMEGKDGPDAHWRVHIFKTFVDTFSEDLAYPQDGEPLETYHVNDLPEEVLPNLKWIIPLCLEDSLRIVSGGM